MYARIKTPVGMTGQSHLTIEIIDNGYNVIAANYPKEWVKLDPENDEPETFHVPTVVTEWGKESKKVYPGRDKHYIKKFAVNVSELTERQFKTLRRVLLCLYNEIHGMTNLSDFRMGSEKSHITKPQGLGHGQFGH